MTLGAGAFAVGLALLAFSLGCAALAGQRLARVTAPGLRGLDAVLAWTLWASAALIGEHLLPLALGILSRGTVVASSALVLGVAIWLDRRRARDAVGVEPSWSLPSSGWLLGLAGLGAVLAAGAALAYIEQHAGLTLAGTDTTNFQIPQLGRWMSSGSMWQLDQFFPDYSNATYPHNGNVILLAVVLPFHSAFLAQLVALPFAALACVAVYAGGREIGAERGWALLAAALAAALPVLDKSALTGAQTDTPMLAFFAGGCYFLLRHRRTAARSDLVLAGLGLGLAFGTKWYGLTTIGPLLAVWAVARVVAGDRVGRVAADGARLIGVMALAGGIWLVRNLVEAGDPVFPQKLGPFTAPRDYIRETAGFSLSHYGLGGHVWSKYLVPQFDSFFAAPGYVLAATIVVGLAIAVWRRAWLLLAVAAAGLAMLVTYWLMPYSAFGPDQAPVLAFASTRYAVPALLAGAVVLARVGSVLPRRLQALAALGVAVALVSGVHTQYRPEVSIPRIAAGVVAVAVLAWIATQAWSLRRRATGLTAAGAVAVLLVAGVGGAAGVRHRFNAHTYASVDPTMAWIERHAPSGHRIGLAGIWSTQSVAPVLPAYGPRLGNHVEYAGPFRHHMLRQYTDQVQFAARLRRSRFDVMIIGRGAAPKGPVVQERWAQQAGFVPVVASARLALLVR